MIIDTPPSSCYFSSDRSGLLYEAMSDSSLPMSISDGMSARSLIILMVATGRITLAIGERRRVNLELIVGKSSISRGYRCKRLFSFVSGRMPSSPTVSDSLSFDPCAGLCSSSQVRSVREPSRLRIRVQSCIISITPRKRPSASLMAT